MKNLNKIIIAIIKNNFSKFTLAEKIALEMFYPELNILSSEDVECVWYRTSVNEDEMMWSFIHKQGFNPLRRPSFEERLEQELEKLKSSNEIEQIFEQSTFRKFALSKKAAFQIKNPDSEILTDDEWISLYAILKDSSKFASSVWESVSKIKDLKRITFEERVNAQLNELRSMVKEESVIESK